MLESLDWKSQDFYTYLGVAGAVVIALSLGLYAVPGGKLKVPAIVVSIIGGLGAGLALGVIFMGMVGYKFKLDTPPDEGPMAMMAGKGGMPMMPPGMMPPGGRPGGGRGPTSKAQLANLVGKLDVLTDKPLAVHLSDEQRKKVKEQLEGLADADDLSNDEAKARVDKLRALLLADQKETLEAAGYRWSGQGGGGGGGPGGGGAQQPANPFKSEQNAKHLKALTARLDKSTKE